MDKTTGETKDVPCIHILQSLDELEPEPDVYALSVEQLYFSCIFF